MRLQSKAASLFPFILLLAVISLASCKKKTSNQLNEPSRILARVHDSYLYFRDLDSALFVKGMGRDDSLKVLNLYIEQWIQKQVLIKEAENNVGSNPEIEKLVQDYRNSLLIQQYENAMVREKIGSEPFSEADYKKYYDENKSEYLLGTNMMRCYFVKAPNTLPDVAVMRGYWQGGTFPYNDVLVFCNAHSKDSVHYSLEESTWHEQEFFAAKIPETVLANAISSRNLVATEGNYTYFVRILEYAPAGSSAPYSYVVKDIMEIMAYQRKSKFLEQLRRDIYEKSKNANQIEVYQ